MQLIVVLIIAIVASASAFAPRSFARTPVKAMAMKQGDFKFPIKQLAIPAVVLPFLAPMAAMAAEGTGRAFGIDDSRLIWAALLPSFIIFPLYLQWSGQQESDDFFDGYEKRRQG
mmetsp:Transcript_4052/g.4181  ORF Transcript_4052/g.4181 Transcript_4052/m.4181 type:complete len:115 (-) Transcript_4052:443-787(-)